MPEAEASRCGHDVIIMRGARSAIVAAAAGMFFLHEAAALVVPLLVSILIAYALEPVVSLFMRLRLPRIAAAVLTYVLVAVATGSLARSLHEHAATFVNELPAELRALSTSIGATRSGEGPFQQLETEIRRLQAWVGSPASTAPEPGVARVTPVGRLDVRGFLVEAARGAFAFTRRMFVVGLLTFLFLATGDVLARKLVALADTPAGRRVSIDVIHTINRQIQRYLVARLVIAIIVAVATTIGLQMLGVAHAVVWGAIAGALNILSFVGPAFAVAMIALAALVQFRSLEMTAAAGGIAAAIAVVEGNLITPWLLGRAGELNTVAVFVSILFWGWIWDAWGLLLAVPIMVTIKAAGDHIDPLRPLSELLGR